jgi:hypothetical protein
MPQQEEHVGPKCKTGNHFSVREVHGVDSVNLAIYRMVCPKTHLYLYKVAAYIQNRNPANPPYPKAQIYHAETRLGLSRKVGLTTSDLAFLSVNLCKRERERYWNSAYPEGIANQSTEDMIDINKAKFLAGSGYFNFISVGKLPHN